MENIQRQIETYKSELENGFRHRHCWIQNLYCVVHCEMLTTKEREIMIRLDTLETIAARLAITPDLVPSGNHKKEA